MNGSRSVEEKQAKQLILSDDIAFIKESLARSDTYDFKNDLKERLDKLGISVNAFAKRLNVSHTVINKYLAGAVLPGNKERMKELGMALGMDKEALDDFLHANCYTKLTVKNPYDDICILMLKGKSDTVDIVSRYRACISEHRLAERGLPKEHKSIPTANISLSMEILDNSDEFDDWLDKYQSNFNAFDKWILPSKNLIRFVLLYVGDSSINEMYRTGQLPASIRSLLYPLLKDREVLLRGLRTKLVVFGICNDMTEDEMDLMLEYAQLRTLSQARTALDFILLTAVRCGHERYPYYEYLSLDKRLVLLKDILKDRSGTTPADTFYEGLLHNFSELYKNACERITYYDLPGKTGETERLFEQYYTCCTGHGLADYIYDVLQMLQEDEGIAGKDIQSLIETLAVRFSDESE